MPSVFSGKALSEHSSKDSCWIVLYGKVYDVTDFLEEHPGGSKIILKYGGKDATAAYDPIHPPNAITSNLPVEKLLGEFNPNVVDSVAQVVDADKRTQALLAARPPLEEMLNLHDFEAVAKRILPAKAWGYYNSGADDEISMRENRIAFQRVWFRPRILRNVSQVNYSTQILGCPSTLPVFICATALGKLGHPNGEVNYTRAAAKHGLIQMIPTLGSCTLDECLDAASPGQNQFLQLYVNPDRAICEKYVRHAEKRGIKALFITVDAPQLGRREKDMRVKLAEQVESGSAGGDQGVARSISSAIDPSLNWEDIKWFKSITKMPIILKGVQSWEDAAMAIEAGLQGILISNHAGRQMDMALSGIEILHDVVTALRERGLFPRPGFEIYIDGGVRRASDVIKALALGATAVGIGRGFLYAHSAYGQDGVERAITILRDEFEMCLRFLGAPSLKDITPQMVDVTGLKTRSTLGPVDDLFKNTYQPLELAKFRDVKL